MEAFQKCVLQSVATARGMYGTKKQSHEEHVRHLRKMNNCIINEALGDGCLDASKADEELAILVTHFLWLSPCCEDATSIGDCYNETHLTGLLLCKYLHTLLRESTGDRPQDLFPEVPEVHVFDVAMYSMDIDQTMLWATCLQQYWCRLYWNHESTALKAVAAVMARMGYFLIYKTRMSENSMSSNLEQSPLAPEMAYPKKKTVRSFLCIVLVMLRSLATKKVTKKIGVASIQGEERKLYLQGQAYSTERQGALMICEPVHLNIMRMKRIGGNGANPSMSFAMQDEPLWNYVRSQLPDNAIGEAPRRFSERMNTLLTNSCVVLRGATSYFQKNAVLHECAHVLEAALSTFYIVPAMDKYKKLRLVSDIRGGQRINYAFDYVNFDSGDVTQVLYLHNPLYKQCKAPSTIREWDSGPQGPLSAFMAFDPTVQMHFEDEQDPLGILGLACQVSRPSEHAKMKQSVSGGAGELRRFAFLLNQTGLFLIDRETSSVYTSEPDDSCPHHYALYLLCLYAFLNRQISEIVKVAINSVKIASTETTSRHA